MARKARLPELPALGALDRQAGGLALQLTQALRVAIRRGDLRPGEALPSTRMLAQALRLARGTVVEAYDQLVAEGFLEARPGAGTRVAPLPDVPPVTPPVASPAPRLPPAAAALARIAADFRPLPHIPFAISVPLGPTAPDDAWRRLGNRLRARGAAAAAGYGDPQGALELRQAIAEHVRKSRSCRCDAAQVIVTGGTQQGLYLACQVLLGKGQSAWVENPAYGGITSILEQSGHGAVAVRVPVDDEGMVVGAGEQLAPYASAAFVTPSHQYPLGMPLSMTRREALLAWARKAGAWIVEDDYDSELRYSGHPFPAMQGLDPERVVYLGTFSKVLYPSLRLGYLIAPPALVAAFCGARVLMDRSPPGADQHVLAAYIGQGHLERHIRRVRSVYAEQRAQLIALLGQWLPAHLGRLQPSDQGMHLLLWLHPALDDRAVAQRAAAAGVAVRPVSPMFAAGTARPGLVLGFGGFSAHRLQQAARQLAAVIADSARDQAIAAA
ncbi:PLP-dependent aminotransferase family protein [Herbaspirillum sp. YR522]|uniref:MocR-like pyridoxine biosynthesis transcription factor PdxR n=1 Tax=Herbaspirillum sp. YR522 TaxID=1144342 RepID=UPI00026FC559|nr:PLP-dependent aminotransferase family protein [Herbaspirillum sp. YR522]EJM95601.1 transcriptional regulator with HTH domain and aminotransferase domain containing protein [Herbaspirillum sp. YR522]